MTLSLGISNTATPTQQPTPLVANNATSSGGLSFADVLDTVNPLQHIPVVSSIYRAITGSHISARSQIAGDTLYGSLLPGGAIAGLASSAADVAVKAVSGKSISELVIGAVTPSASSSTSASASATPLVATSTTTPKAGTAALIPPVPYAAFNYHTDASSSQYQRAQAFDAINRKLLKMTA